MSGSNAKSRTELKSKLGKRKKDEEFIDDDDESPANKQTSRSNHRNQQSGKVKYSIFNITSTTLTCT